MPHFSSGERDDLIQRRGLEALLSHWSQSGAHNPLSSLYDGPMVEADWVHVLAFDARPWPDFPARQTVWADGGNWRLGHWLNGRAGLVPVARIVSDIAGQCEVSALDVEALDDLVSGYVLAQAGTGRDALAPLVNLLGLSVIEGPQGLVVRSAGRFDGSFQIHDRQAGDAGDFQVHYPAAEDQSRDTRLYHLDDSADYAPAVASARQAVGASGVDIISAPVLADPSLAQRWAEQHFARQRSSGGSVIITLPPSALALMPGDKVGFAGQDYRIEALQGGTERQAHLVPWQAETPRLAGSEAGTATGPLMPPARPVLLLLNRHPDGLLAAVHGRPWSAPVELAVSTDGAVFEARGQCDQRAIMGELLTDLAPGPVGYWDEAGSLEVCVYEGRLESRARRDVFAGKNRLAIEQAGGEWEVMDFARAELVAEQCYRLSGLLRGQAGSVAAGAKVGARLVLLDGALATLSLAAHETGIDLSVRAWPAASSVQNAAIEPVVSRRRGARCHAPVHLRLSRSADEVRARWIRCTRIGGDHWGVEDVPLGEAEELYEVRVSRSQGEVLRQRVTTPAWQSDVSTLTALAGGAGTVLTIHVAQISRDSGAGLSARADITL